jgi:hypothetical protein
MDNSGALDSGGILSVMQGLNNSANKIGFADVLVAPVPA